MLDENAVPPGLDIQPRHWTILRTILSHHLPDREVWAFGSRVKGSAKPHSDLDLVVLGTEPLSIALHARLSEALTESDLPWRVDLVDWATTSEAFRALMSAHKVVIKQPDAAPSTSPMRSRPG